MSQQVFGTVVDWRKTVTSYLSKQASKSLNAPSKSLSTQVRMACAGIDWADFAQDWRTSYYEFTRSQVERKNKGEEMLFKTVDDHHHDSLKELISSNKIGGLWTDEEVLEVSLIWHNLDGWPDSSAGLHRLEDQGLILCTLSNGNIPLLEDMAHHASLPWTHVFSPEYFGAYKPHPSVYIGACKELGLEPGECAMVAAHLGDLQAAKDCGLQTIYIERPEEESWPLEKVREAKRKGFFDIWIGRDDMADGGGILEMLKHFETPASLMH